MKNNPDNLGLHEAREIPPVADMLDMLQTAVTLNSDRFTKMQNAKYIREARWAGKDGTGKKGRDEKGRNIGPWDGSSDTSVRLAEQICWEKNLVTMLAMQRCQLTATPQGIEDGGSAATAVSLMRYYLTGAMELEVWMEAGRLADTMHTYGRGVMRVDWKESRRMVRRKLTFEDLLDWARRMGEQAAVEELADLAREMTKSEGQNPNLTQEQAAQVEEIAVRAGEEAAGAVTVAVQLKAERPRLVEVLKEFDATMCHGEPVRVARLLQASRVEEIEYYGYETTESRPQWTSLKWGVDVFYMGTAPSLQDEPFIARVKWVTAFQLKEMAALGEWDEKWVATVLENPGRAFATAGLTAGLDWILQNTDVGWSIPANERNTKWYELVFIEHKAANEKGIIGVYECLVHQAVPDSYGFYRLVDNPDGEYPYVEVPREVKDRREEAWGIPEAVEEEQQQLKELKDSARDLTSLQMQPPMLVHWKELDNYPQGQIKPRGVLPNREGAESRFMPIPGNIANAVTDEVQIRQTVMRRFGLLDPSVPEALTQMCMEVEAGHFLKFMSAILAKTFMLLQRYMDPVKGARVAGGPEVFAAGEGNTVLNATREEINGRYDFHLSFDTRDLNLEWVMKQLDAVIKMVGALDHAGLTDLSTLLRYALAAINPRLAGMVASAPDAAAREAKEEQTAWAVIATGNEPPMPEKGVDFQTRLQVWKDMLGRGPVTLADGKQIENPVVQILQGNEVTLELARTRLRYLKQGVVQQQNAVTGRRGTPGTFEQMAEGSLIGE